MDSCAAYEVHGRRALPQPILWWSERLTKSIGIGRGELNKEPTSSRKDRSVIRLAQRGRRPHERIEHRLRSKVERLITLSTSAVAVCC